MAKVERIKRTTIPNAKCAVGLHKKAVMAVSAQSVLEVCPRCARQRWVEDPKRAKEYKNKP